MKSSPTLEWMQPIIRVPLQQAFPKLGEVKEFSNKICLFNHNRTRVFDVVSPKYQVIPHGEAFGRIQRGLTEYFGQEAKADVRSINHGARIYADFRIPTAPIKLGKHDVNELRVIMRNSYDRVWSFSAMLGAFRLVCSNGMMVGENFAGIKGKHVGTLDDQSMLHQLDGMIQRAPMLKQLWQEWEGTRITYDQAVELLAGQFPDKYLSPVLTESVFPQSKWALYNSLTHFATHDTKSLQRRVEFDEKIATLFYGGITIEGEVTDEE